MAVQQNVGNVTRQTKPPVTLTLEEHEKLSVLCRAAASSMPDVVSVLAEELDRARVLPKGRHAEHAVCMGCEVDFRDDSTGKVQTVTLVYPEAADIAQRKISVLTPIGTALIGVREGHSITWETRNAELRRLTVLEVRDPRTA